MSKTTKGLIGQTVDLANTMASQAKKVFGAADQTFHTISSTLTSIVNKGEQQFGFSGGEFQALNAAAVNAGATMKRNLIAQARSSGQPVNVAAIDQIVADKTATAVNANEIAGYERGNQDFWKATSGLESAPGIYGVANEFNKNALTGLETATKAQENRDAAGGGWKNLVKTGLTLAGDLAGSFIGDPGLGGQVMGVVSPKQQPQGQSATSTMFGANDPFAAGAGNLDTTGGSSIGEQFGNFFKGMGQG